VIQLGAKKWGGVTDMLAPVVWSRGGPAQSTALKGNFRTADPGVTITRRQTAKSKKRKGVSWPQNQGRGKEVGGGEIYS